MKSPNNITNESEWKAYCERKQFTNDGRKGWFADDNECLHWWDDFITPSPEDIRRMEQASVNPIGYYESQWFIALPENVMLRLFEARIKEKEDRLKRLNIYKEKELIA